MPPAKIFLMRHAEKPPGDPPAVGVELDGTHDTHSLIVQGWQRAGALVPFFSLPWAPSIASPTYLYAPPPDGKDDAGGRPYETITPLASKLNKMAINTKFAVGDETKLVADVLTRDGLIVLITWEHDHIPLIANALLANKSAPQCWPGNRFDIVWVFTPQGGGWVFSQIPQLLLAGDQSSVIT